MNNKRVENTFDFWKKSKNIQDRLPLFKEAIKAHTEGNFYLSVSCLVPQVEGLLRNALRSIGRNDDFSSMRTDDISRATHALTDQWKSRFQDLPQATVLLESLPDAVSDLYHEFNPSTREIGKLYRHGVCHGLQTDFGSLKNSLRLILLLDRIVYFYAEVQSSSKDSMLISLSRAH